jgi:hypothetical protein
VDERASLGFDVCESKRNSQKEFEKLDCNLKLLIKCIQQTPNSTITGSTYFFSITTCQNPKSWRDKDDFDLGNVFVKSSHAFCQGAGQV